MQVRKLVFLRPREAAANQPLHALGDHWQVHPIDLDASAWGGNDAHVGLVLLSSRVGADLYERHLRSGLGIEWVALVQAEDLDDPEVCRLILEYCRDYHTLPIEPQRLLTALGHAYGMSLLETSVPRQPPQAYGLVGRSRAMRSLMNAVRKVASVDAPVLIQGESGTGKELAARAVHEASPRAHGPFIAVNCGALPSGLIQSELFGHEAGAFTGALKRKIGRIEAAHGGTIFLDEIGDLALDLQVNLLRFLQEGCMERLGSTTPVEVDVRIVAATHVDLEAAVAEKRFRADLYYRLNVLRLDMPPLRARPEDVMMLAEHYFNHYAHDRAAGVRGFSPEAREAMVRHGWPGNVRELINRVRRAMVMCEGRWIGAADLGLAEVEPVQETLAERRAQAERAAVEEALASTGNNVSQAAAVLGISRVTLYRLLERYGIGTGVQAPIRITA